MSAPQVPPPPLLGGTPYGAPPPGAPPTGAPPYGAAPPGAPPYGYPPPPGAPPHGYPPPPGDPYAVPRTHPLAVVSLVCGILSLPACCCWGVAVPLEIASLVCGFLALAKIRAEPERHSGRGLCVAGMICAGTSLLFSLVWLAGNVRESIRSRYGVNV